MPEYDWPLSELRSYRPQLAQPDDLADFWSSTLATARERYTPPRAARIDVGLRIVDTFDLRFSGFDGEAIAGWWQTPRDVEPNAVIVEFRGYSRNRGAAHETGSSRRRATRDW